MAPECEGGVGVGATNARDPKGGVSGLEERSPGNWWETQILEPHPNLLNQKPGRSQRSGFMSPPGGSD